MKVKHLIFIVFLFFIAFNSNATENYPHVFIETILDIDLDDDFDVCQNTGSNASTCEPESKQWTRALGNGGVFSPKKLDTIYKRIVNKYIFQTLYDGMYSKIHSYNVWGDDKLNADRDATTLKQKNEGDYIESLSMSKIDVMSIFKKLLIEEAEIQFAASLGLIIILLMLILKQSFWKILKLKLKKIQFKRLSVLSLLLHL